MNTEPEQQEAQETQETQETQESQESLLFKEFITIAPKEWDARCWKDGVSVPSSDCMSIIAKNPPLSNGFITTSELQVDAPFNDRDSAEAIIFLWDWLESQEVGPIEVRTAGWDADISPRNASLFYIGNDLPESDPDAIYEYGLTRIEVLVTAVIVVRRRQNNDPEMYDKKEPD